MPILKAILELRDTTIVTQQDAADFLQRFDPVIQKTTMAAVYFGIDHHEQEKIRDDIVMSTEMISQVPPERYAQKLYANRTFLEKYLNDLLYCAQNSNFDLNNIKIV